MELIETSTVTGQTTALPSDEDYGAFQSIQVSADLTPKQVAQLAKVVKQEFRDEIENV